MTDFFRRASRSLRALGRATVFFLKVFPMLPSRPVDWVTRPPLIERVRYPTQSGNAEGEVYRPDSPGVHPGIVVCLGVVPFEVNHPQVPVLGRALARAGFAALLYWSPAMRDFRLDPADIENIALAYRWFIEQPFVDATRSGLLGTCVGGSFALMAAAHPLINQRVAYVSAYAPYSSLWTFAKDIASGSVGSDDGRRLWRVDPLTRKVFVHSLTALLEAEEAAYLRRWFLDEQIPAEAVSLSEDSGKVAALLSAADAEEAESALHALPMEMQSRLTAISPLSYVQNLQVPLMVLLHDRGDQVIPVGESRRLCSALGSREGVFYTEMQFSHLDPAKGKLPPWKLAREFFKFLAAVYRLFLHVVE
ncbi:MAG: hypothetical protein KatS3mg045_1506 [Bellilinea sp.]|nr:MAG: hypothetical protein KatS3mg045_1506 [Bellilinea sp.]